MFKESRLAFSHSKKLSSLHRSRRHRDEYDIFRDLRLFFPAFCGERAIGGNRGVASGRCSAQSLATAHSAVHHYRVAVTSPTTPLLKLVSGHLFCLHYVRKFLHDASYPTENWYFHFETDVRNLLTRTLFRSLSWLR